MMNTICTRHFSPAMVVACVALMVALGGVSYAAGALPKNSVGAAPGPVGPQGDPGATGSPGLSEVELVQVTATNNTPQRWAIVHPSCPDGKRVIAAGGNISTALADEGKVVLTDAFPLSNNTAKVGAEEIAGHTPGSWTLVGYATCAKVQ